MGMYREAIRQRYREVREQMKKIDMVNNPPYNKSGIATIDAIKAMTDGGYEYYLQGNIMKYLWRYRYKNGVEDLKKAQWYLNELIDELEDDKSKDDDNSIGG